MRDALGKFADAGEASSGQQLAEKVAKAPQRVALDLPQGLPAADSYQKLAKSVFLIGSVYKCGKCDKWHDSGAATAWSLTADGVMVTNHHVLQNAKGDSWGVCGADGEVYRITEVLAADPAADVAFFRVDTRGTKLTPLALADRAKVGTRVRIVSHPDGRFFFQSSGEVSRYAKSPARGDQPEKTWMSVTADYAKGSSGGPVVNRRGRVVGIVSNTQSIYYGARDPKAVDKQGPLQMVVKNCVPVAALHAMIADPDPELEANTQPSSTEG